MQAFPGMLPGTHKIPHWNRIKKSPKLMRFVISLSLLNTGNKEEALQTESTTLLRFFPPHLFFAMVNLNMKVIANTSMAFLLSQISIFASAKRALKTSANQHSDHRHLPDSDKSSSASFRSLKTGDKAPNHGTPSKIEFNDESEKCISATNTEEGFYIVTDDCDDSPTFIYREDMLLQLEDAKLCLLAVGDKIKLEKCNDENEFQKWYFVHVPASDGYFIYKIINSGTSGFIDSDDYETHLQAHDDNEKNQLFNSLSSDFFKMRQAY